MNRSVCSLGFGSQLELSLGDPVLNVPWAGRSPRGLTRGANIVILKAQAAKEHGRFILCNQLEMWPAAENAAGDPSPAAPSLLPLPWESI